MLGTGWKMWRTGGKRTGGGASRRRNVIGVAGTQASGLGKEGRKRKRSEPVGSGLEEPAP